MYKKSIENKLIKRLASSVGSSNRTSDLNAIVAASNGAQVTSRAHRLMVEIIEVKDLKKRYSGASPKDPFFKLKVEGVSERSKEIKNFANQDGALKVNQNFIFDVKDPKTAELSIRVHGKGLFGLQDFIGTCQIILIKDLLEPNDGAGDVESKWYDLYSKDRRKKLAGKILMHIVVGMAEPEQRICAYVGTWNVGNAKPPMDLSAWLPTDAQYEIVAIGTQESDYEPSPPFTECSKEWLETCKHNLGSRYRVVRAISRGQMWLVVFVRDDAEKAISQVDSDSEATGVGHVIANKGGVCISFKFWDTGLCFVNSHFAAHDGHCDTRNSNYREIVGELRVGHHSMDILSQFHHVFWMGDLNYRLDFSNIDERPMIPQRRLWHTNVKRILDGEYKDLLQYDELSREKSISRVFHGFKEADINFPPTFKMQKGSTNTYSQKRMPAWCDRVLWRTLQGCHVDPLSYSHSPTILTSDHKPVSATFALTTHALPSNLVDSTEVHDKGWHIQFTSLKAKNLRSSDINGYSDPYVSFIGSNLIQHFHSKVKYQTLNPVWNQRQDLPTLVFKTFPLQRLEKEYLMIQVLDYDYASTNDSLGYAVIPLAPIVSALKNGRGEPTSFNVELLYHGVPAGNLEGAMKLTWERNANKRRSGFARGIVTRTLSLQESFRRRVSTRNPGGSGLHSSGVVSVSDDAPRSTPPSQVGAPNIESNRESFMPMTDLAEALQSSQQALNQSVTMSGISNGNAEITNDHAENSQAPVTSVSISSTSKGYAESMDKQKDST